MGSVIGAYHRDATVVQRLLQGFAVGFGLNGGVTLDARAELGIVAVREIKVAYSSLSSNLSPLSSLLSPLSYFIPPLSKQLQLSRRRQKKLMPLRFRQAWRKLRFIPFFFLFKAKPTALL